MSESEHKKRRLSRYDVGQLIYPAGAESCAWRVLSGSVRLDQVEGEEREFAMLALPGDVIGAETLLFGRTTFEARALANCSLEPWLEDAGAPSGDTLLGMLAMAERRTSEIVNLRCGQALGRVRRLIELLTREHRGKPQRTALPGLRDMAEITDLTIETVSRAIGRLTLDGVLSREGKRGATLARHRHVQVSG